MSRIVKGIGSGVGLAREAYIARSRSHSPNPSTDPGLQAQHEEAHLAGDEDSESDEEDWTLDDAQNDPPPSYDASQSAQDIDGIVQDFGRQHPEQSSAGTQAQLSFPVIVPQRRPEKKERGFVKAYAPALEGCGIDQKTFLDFLFAFEKAIKVHPAFQAVNIACMACGPVPILSVQITSQVVQIATIAAARTKQRKDQNDFLAKMNDTLFKPHGLYALIVSYDTRSSSPSSSFDLSSAIAKETSGGLSNTFKKSSHKSSSLPLDAAPLIFPALDALPDEQKRNAFKRGGDFVAEYYDRRSQAIFRQQNPGNDKLTVGHDPQFASRYSDPNSAANSGSLMALVTGGAFDPKKVRLARRNRKRQMMGLPPQQGSLKDKLKAKRGDSMLDKARRTLKQDVLYLMIVNLPAEAELEAAANELAATRA